jgi:hypothetical protein
MMSVRCIYAGSIVAMMQDKQAVQDRSFRHCPRYAMRGVHLAATMDAPIAPIRFWRRSRHDRRFAGHWPEWRIALPKSRRT